jgi:hypothetical protein
VRPARFAGTNEEPFRQSRIGASRDELVRSARDFAGPVVTSWRERLERDDIYDRPSSRLVRERGSLTVRVLTSTWVISSLGATGLVSMMAAGTYRSPAPHAVLYKSTTGVTPAAAAATAVADPAIVPVPPTATYPPAPPTATPATMAGGVIYISTPAAPPSPAAGAMGTATQPGLVTDGTGMPAPVATAPPVQPAPVQPAQPIPTRAPAPVATQAPVATAVPVRTAAPAPTAAPRPAPTMAPPAATALATPAS